MRRLEGVKIGCVMTGSFCTFREVFDSWRLLKAEGAELYPIMSFNAAALDTRFYAAADSVRIFEEITGRKIWNSIPEVEPIGPKKLLDLLVVAPCTGNTLAKINAGITDTPAALAVKSHLRNARPVLLAVSTNDGLGRNARNIGDLMFAKHFFFVPFRQDDCYKKANSLVADFNLLADSACAALENRQIQPVLPPFSPEKA